MNLVLFRAEELVQPVPISDPRARHVLQILGLTEDDSFDAGVINGRRGKARIRTVTDRHLELEFKLDTDPPGLHPVTLLVGCPRPVVARRILRDLTSLGVEKMIFFAAEKGERSYLEASLWKSDQYRESLIAGAEQAFSTYLPAVQLRSDLEEALSGLGPPDNSVALDNYESTVRMADWRPGGPGQMVLAVGSERGWSVRERSRLREAGFQLAGLGPRVLRTETACVTGVSLALAAGGFL